MAEYVTKIIDPTYDQIKKTIDSSNEFPSLASELETAAMDVQEGFIKVLDYMFSNIYYNSGKGIWAGVDAQTITNIISGLAKAASREVTASSEHICPAYDKVYNNLKPDLDAHFEHVKAFNDTVLRREAAVKKYNNAMALARKAKENAEV